MDGCGARRPCPVLTHLPASVNDAALGGKGHIMLTIFGKRDQFCDGISRRNFLKIGAFGFGVGQLTLPQLLRAEAEQGIGKSHKAVIMVYLPGGPSHQDMYDIKT